MGSTSVHPEGVVPRLPVFSVKVSPITSVLGVPLANIPGLRLRLFFTRRLFRHDLGKSTFDRAKGSTDNFADGPADSFGLATGNGRPTRALLGRLCFHARGFTCRTGFGRFLLRFSFDDVRSRLNVSLGGTFFRGRSLFARLRFFRQNFSHAVLLDDKGCLGKCPSVQSETTHYSLSWKYVIYP